MNYLAHIALSGTDMEVALGNFMGDGVKGTIPLHLPKTVRVGLHLHRFIDHQSDTHPENLEMRVLLRAKYSKYAGVVQDMYHDHFLSRFWGEYEERPLTDLLDSFYSVAQERFELMPARQRRFFVGMKEGSWMTSYGTLSGMGRAFQGLSSRSASAVVMRDGATFLEERYDEFEKGFRQWYPILQGLCEKERAVLLKNLSNSSDD